MEVDPVLSSTVLLGTSGVHGGGPCPLSHCVTGYWRCTWRWALSSQVLCYWVLAVYMETGPVLSSTVLLVTGGVHRGGHCPLKHCVTGYWQCIWRWSTGGVHRGGHCPLKHCLTGYWQCTWRWGTGGVHRGGQCPLKHCVTGYWRCTWRWSLPSQALCYWVLAVYMEVGPAVSSTVLLGTLSPQQMPKMYLRQHMCKEVGSSFLFPAQFPLLTGCWNLWASH